ncbi:MAG: hypothetical protein ACLPHI_19605 [Terriglobales bacterium]
MSGVDSGALVAGAIATAGTGPGSDAGMLGCEVCPWGTAGTDAPGTRGKENTSLNPAKWGSSAHGSVLPGAAFPAGEDGAAARSEPLGGPVGGDGGTAGTPGKEYISAAGGICGAKAHGAALPASEDDEENGITAGGATAVTCGASGNSPASDAAMARKSASFSAPVDAGSCGTLGTAFCTAGKENIPRGKSGTAAPGAAGIVPAWSADGDDATFGGAVAPGSAAKNSFASFAITAGSGTADIKGETPWYFFVPSSCAIAGVEDDVGESVAN